MSNIDFGAIPVPFFWAEQDFKAIPLPFNLILFFEKIPFVEKMNDISRTEG